VESAHHQFKRAVDQRLRLRGHRDFASLEAYQQFLETWVGERNATRSVRFAEERQVLRPLPVRRLEACRELFATVSRWSSVRVVGKAYSVPARLIGQRLRVRLYAAHLELEYRGETVVRLERRHEQEPYRIDYRHLIHDLVRKPGAFRRYVYREALFPSATFRRAYDALVAHRAVRADLEYLRLLHLAATTGEAAVERALAARLVDGEVPDYPVIQAQVAPTPAACPQVTVTPPDLRVYDRLLTSAEGAP
jgi:hypothetical protein